MLDRRNFLAFGAASVAALLTPDAAEAAVRKAAPRSISLYNLHTGETVRTVYWQDGRYLKRSVDQASRLLRDHRTGEICPYNPRVFDLLFALQQKLQTRGPFHVVSGYRSPATNALLISTTDGVAERSLHLCGQAVDIRIPGVPLKTLGRAALSLRAGGVGVYQQSGFVHVDIGRTRRW